jgi:hypothetical protein
MVRPGRESRREAGSLLLEMLLSLSLTLLVIMAALPVVSWSRALGADVSRRALQAEGAQLTGLRFMRDVRRAGFGLSPGEESLTVDPAGGRVEMAFLEGGFDGGVPVVEAAPPGQTYLSVAALSGFAAGDKVALRDRWGRAFRTTVTTPEPALLRLHLRDPLPFPALPEAGARVYRIVRREWSLADSGLRRDGQPALDPPVDWRAAALPATAAESALSWLEGGADGSPAGESGDVIVAVRLSVGGMAGSSGPPGLRPGDGRPRRALILPLLAGARNQAGHRAWGSPLP